MSYQNISYSMSPADREAVLAAIQSINNLMPFLVTLDAEERKALFKLGAKSADFVQDASAAVTAFPTILPPSFDTAEFQRDTSLFQALASIKLVLDSLTEKVNHTYLAVGSEAMGRALEVYAYVQTAKDRTPGLGSVADKLRERFRGQGRKKSVGTEAG